MMRAYIAVYEQGSMTKAARILGKTKALVSTHITRLEDLLETRLITRSTRSLHFTQAGKTYYLQSKQIIDNITSLEASLKQRETELVGRLRISAPTTYGEQKLIPVLAKMMTQHPQLNLDIVLTDRYVDLVEEGFDAAIRIGHLPDSTLIAIKVGEVNMCCCASAQALDRIKSPQHPQELSELPCIHDTNSNQGRQWLFYENNSPLKVKLSPLITANGAAAAANLAKHHVGFCYVPDFAVESFIKTNRLYSVLESYLPPPLPINLIFTHRQYLSHKVRVLANEIKAYLYQ